VPSLAQDQSQSEAPSNRWVDLLPALGGAGTVGAIATYFLGRRKDDTDRQKGQWQYLEQQQASILLGVKSQADFLQQQLDRLTLRYDAQEKEKQGLEAKVDALQSENFRFQLRISELEAQTKRLTTVEKELEECRKGHERVLRELQKLRDMQH